MTRGAGLARRRAAAQRTLLAAAVCVILPALVLVTLIRMHSAASERDGVRHALDGIPELERTVAVRVQADMLLRQKATDLVTVTADVLFADAFAGVRHTTTHAAASAQYDLAGRPANAPESVYVWAVDHAADHLALRQGGWPKPVPPGPAPGTVFEAAVPQDVATAHGWHVGDTVTAASRLSPSGATFRISGVFAPVDVSAGSAFWQLDPLLGKIREKQDQPVSGPLLVDASVPAGALIDLKRIDIAVTPDFAGVLPDAAAKLSRRLPAFDAQAAALKPDASTQTTLTDDLVPLVSGIAADREISARLILLPVLELALLAFTALVLTTRLLAEHRRETDGLLRARGASVPGLFRTGLTEGLALALPLALISPVIARILLRQLADSGWSSVTPTGVALTGDLWFVALSGALFAALLLAVAGLRSSGSFVEAAREKSRSGARTAVQKAGLDVMVVALGVGAFWEVAQYGDGSAHSGSLGLPLVASPAILLRAWSLGARRLLPFLVGTREKLAARRRGAVGALAGWRVGRTARAYAAPMTLLIMAVSVGVQAVVFVTSADRSAADQAAHAVGSDVRISGLPAGQPGQAGALAAVPGAGTGALVTRGDVSLGTGDSAVDVTVLGVDPARAAGAVTLRSDLAAQPWPALTDALVSDGWGRDGDIPGVALPGRPAGVSVDVAYRGSADSALGPLRVQALVVDAYGAGSVLELGTVPAADGAVHTLTARPDPKGGAIAYPLRVTALSLQYVVPACPSSGSPHPDPRCATDDEHDAAGDAEHVAVSVGRLAADGTAVRLPADTAPVLLADPADVKDPHHLDMGCVGKSGTALAAGSGTGLFTLTEESGFCVDTSEAVAHTVQLAPGGRAMTTVPALVGNGLLAKLRLKVGDTYRTDAFGLPGTTIRFVGSMDRMPGQTDPARGVLVVPIGFADSLNAHSGGASGGTEWWVKTAAGTSPSRLAARYAELDAAALLGTRTISDRQTEAAAIRHDPLRSGLRLTLVVAALAALLFILIGFALHAVIAIRERSAELALLNALGMSRRQTAGLLLAEQAMLVLLGGAAGGALAAVTIRSVLPLMILTDAGVPPVPPPLVLFDLPLLGTVGAIAVLFLLATVALVVSTRRRDALGRALRSGEER